VTWLFLVGLAHAAPLAPVLPVVDADLPPHEASATISADGSFTLVLLPERPWTAAEVSVRGAQSIDLGATDGSAPIEVSGVVDAVGTLSIELWVVTPEAHGVAWTFSVDPELLPIEPPVMAPAAERRRGWWPFRSRSGA